MADINEILQPDNLFNDKPKGDSNEKLDTKARLESLKEMMKSDPINLDTSNMLLNTDSLPSSQNIKYVDYTEEKKNHTAFATQCVNNIVSTYVRQPEKLGPRIKDLIQDYIVKYGRLLLLIEVSERNLITLQEGIDSGDMSTDMFMNCEKAQNRVILNMDAADKHIKECEKYWAAYAETHGMEDEETKIIQEADDKNEDIKKHAVVDMVTIIEQIRQTNNEKNDKDKAAKKKISDAE